MDTGIFILDRLTTSPLLAGYLLIALIIAVTVHEFAHAYAAARQGDQTAKLLGRLSLNPLSHLDPAGSLLFLVAGIGWGRPVPVNPYNLRDGRRGDFYVSIAGIVVNLIVALIFSIPLQIANATGGAVTTAALLDSGNYALLFCDVVRQINILLAAFNLLPIPPLDGSKAIGILVPRRLEPAYQRYLQVGPIILIGILMAAFLLQVNLLQPVLYPLTLLFDWLTYIPTSLQLG